VKTSIEIPIIMVWHTTKSTQPLGLVVWCNKNPPKSNWMVLMGGVIVWFKSMSCHLWHHMIIMFLSSYTITTTNDGSIHQTFNKDTIAWEKIKAQLVEVLSWAWKLSKQQDFQRTQINHDESRLNAKSKSWNTKTKDKNMKCAKLKVLLKHGLTSCIHFSKTFYKLWCKVYNVRYVYPISLHASQRLGYMKCKMRTYLMIAF